VFSQLRRHFTFANTVSVIALFVALGGGAYAAFNLPPDSVRSKNIVNGQVRTPDLAKPQGLKSAGLTPATGDCSDTPNQWVSLGGDDGPVGYYRDIDGQVHLNGTATTCGGTSGNSVIFTLPKGYRPVLNDNQATADAGITGVVVYASDGEVVAIGSASADAAVSFDGITFRCAPSGKNGCP
jgi:hypothetical protein